MPRLYPVLFALCVPLVFLHADYQPSFTVSLGGSDATLYLSDLAVLAIGAIGAVAGIRLGFAPLRAGRAIWISSAVFLAFVLAGTAVGAATTDGYPLADNLLTTAKLTEYALLALAAPLAIRGAQELTPLLVVLTAWSTAATFGALLQFLGVLNEFEGRRPGSASRRSSGSTTSRRSPARRSPSACSRSRSGSGSGSGSSRASPAGSA